MLSGLRAGAPVGAARPIQVCAPPCRAARTAQGSAKQRRATTPAARPGSCSWLGAWGSSCDDCTFGQDGPASLPSVFKLRVGT